MDFRSRVRSNYVIVLDAIVVARLEVLDRYIGNMLYYKSGAIYRYKGLRSGAGGLQTITSITC